MDVTQLQDALTRIFDEEQRLVFWNDPEGEFQGSLADLALDGVEILRLDEHAALELKIRLEQEDPNGRYLLYSPNEEPDYADDWLLDVRLYSRSFRADRASILLDELGLTRQHLRGHIARRRKFFDNKERVRKLKVLVDEDDVELDLDRKMLAVVVCGIHLELARRRGRVMMRSATGGLGDRGRKEACVKWQIQRASISAATSANSYASAFCCSRRASPSLRRFLPGLRGGVSLTSRRPASGR